MPSGCRDLSCFIQYLSRLLLRLSSKLLTTSRTAILRSSREWPGLLKWPAIGFSVRLCVMLLRCPLRRMWRGFCVSPNVLFSALPAFDQVDHVPRLAGGCSTYVEGLFRGRTSEVGARLDMAAGEEASDTTTLVVYRSKSVAVERPHLPTPILSICRCLYRWWQSQEESVYLSKQIRSESLVCSIM